MVGSGVRNLVAVRALLGTPLVVVVLLTLILVLWPRKLIQVRRRGRQ